jgi:hypothetical protein
MKTWNDWWKETKPAECDEYKDYFCECWHVSQSEQYKKDKEKIDALMTALESMVTKIDADNLPISCSIARAAIAKAKGE